ncbi:MAG TPA: PQQ-binding-like beta-propeller repeat protein [Tepidisphaeraceae bacterium]|nr:PQQ-binding-like beta-propeller repeat protein [Tepidisphaeraceae bacterium]
MTKQLMMMLVGAAVISLALSGGGCADNPTPQEQSTIGAIPPNSFVQQWRAPLKLNNDTLSELHLRDDNLYAYTRKNAVYSLSRGGGDTQFLAPVKASGGVLRPPVEIKDRIVFPTATTMEIYRANGRFERRFDLDYSTRSPAAGLENMVFIGLDYPRGGRLAAIDVDRPYANIRWELLTRGGVSAKPGIFEKTVYIGGEDGRVYAVTPDRRPVWPLEGGVFVTHGRIVGDVKVDESGVYVASTDSKLYALDRQTGKVLWQYFGGKPITSDPHVTASTVYINVPDKGIVALDKNKGGFNRKPRWVSKDARMFLSEDARHTYLATRDGKIQAVDRASGKILFHSQGPGFDLFVSNPNNDTIFAARKDGNVYAIKPVLGPGVVGELVTNDGRGIVEFQPVAAAR